MSANSKTDPLRNTKRNIFCTTFTALRAPGGGGTWVFFGWVCAARDSKLAPRSKKNFP